MASNLLPYNASPLERDISDVAARVNDIPVDIASIWNPMTCPIALLPWLAWSLSIDNWRPEWGDDEKRAAVASAIEDQRHKGTRRTVQSVLESFDSLLSIVEWFEQSPAGTPYTFEVILPLIDGDGVAGGTRVSEQFVLDIVQAVSRAKPVRAHFELVQQLELAATALPFSAALAAGYRRLDLVANDGDPGIPWDDLLQDENGEPLTDDAGNFIDGSAP